MKKWKLLLCLKFVLLVSCKSNMEPDRHGNGEVEQILSGDPKGPNIVFIGDGYIQADLRIGGEYEKEGLRIVEHLLSVKPFAYFRDKFNAYIVYAESSQRGADNRRAGTAANTVFETSYSGQSDSSLLIGKENVLETYFQRARDAFDFERDSEIRLLSINIRDLSTGSGGYNRYAIFTRHDNIGNTLVHEVGHVFANLADEYVFSGEVERTCPDAPNVDDCRTEEVKWKKFIGHPNYPEVGIYRGGCYRIEGFFKPEIISLMESSPTGYFNAPSRAAIVKRIWAILGEEYSFYKFVDLEERMGKPSEPPRTFSTATTRHPQGESVDRCPGSSAE